MLFNHEFFYYSLFGKAFEQAAKNKNCHIEADYFDSTSKYEVEFYKLHESMKFIILNIIFFLFTVIRLKIEERPKFLDALAALLA